MPNTEPESKKMPQEVEAWLDNTAKEFRRRYLGQGSSIWNVLGFLFLAIVILVIAWAGREFSAWLSAGPVTEEKNLPARMLTPQTLYEVLGTYQHQVYFFNRSTQKVYRYDPQTKQEKEAFDLVPYETFVWSPSRDKIVFVSSARNSLGNLYVVDLTEPTPQPKLITEREAGINFPSNVIIRGDLPLTWSGNNDRIAFVVRKQTEEKDALFVIAADGSDYYRLPEKERITSLAWANDKIIFVALENGREKRFVVNFDGGNLKEIR